MLNTTHTVRKAVSIDELTNADFSRPLFGDISSIEKLPLKGSSSFSGSRHEKIILHFKNRASVSLVLKIVSPAKDMTIWRSGNFPNREASLVGSEELHEIWDIIQSPYLGYYSGKEESALLMSDLSTYLFPDVRERISLQDEELIIKTLAKLHARFWQRKLDSASWLTKQEVFFDFLGPNAAEEEKRLGRTDPILVAAEEGWKLIEKNLPADLRSFILEPPFEKFTKGLPLTLIHGDSKLGNFAILPNRRLTAFDWTNVAHASPAIEIGWYIAVNASRLSSTKEDFLNKYRISLEKALGTNIDNNDWQQMFLFAILIGARTLLWNKALNVQKNVAGANEEWTWWVEGIGKCCQWK